MGRIIFLLEERSLKVLLEGLLPRLFPGVSFLCVPHEGKQDLERSIPKKLRAWREPGVQFVVIRDNDGQNCRELKSRLVGLCQEGRRTDTLIRLACQEIEAWYLGDPTALSVAYGNPNLAQLASKAAFRDPDSVQHPSDELARLIPEFQKVSGARRIAMFLSEEGHRSASFRALLAGVRQVARTVSANA